MAGPPSHRHRQLAELSAVLATFAFVAFVVVSSGNSGPHETVLASEGNGDKQFAGMWDSWLHKMTVQVRAAVDLSHGLSSGKESKLDDLLKHDMKKDFQKEKKMVKDFDESHGSQTKSVKQAVHSFIKAAPKPVSTSPKAASKAVRAAVKAVKGAKLGYEDKAQRSKTVEPAGGNVITPVAVPLENKLSRDDQTVEVEEMRVKAAENALMREEGVHPTKQAMARHALHAATRSVSVTNKPLKTAEKPVQQQQKQQQRAFSSKPQDDSMAAIKARANKMAAMLSKKAQGASAIMSETEASAKDEAEMQGVMKAILKKADKDGKAAGEAKREETGWGSTLKSWGLAR
mmetsp:Transcript_15310/g.30712  ORF Transcript_15310/g.30712 Transcript_15310/m.30712 type:complete len:345 (+) Transcript_15310:43-1077(+)